MNRDNWEILDLILGIKESKERFSTLQLALIQARNLAGKKYEMTISKTQDTQINRGEHCTDNDVNIQDLNEHQIDEITKELAAQAKERTIEDTTCLFSSLCLYLIILDQLGHIFGSRDVKRSNKIAEAIRTSKINAGLNEKDIEALADLRNSLNHNYGLAAFNPNTHIGKTKYVICLDDDGTRKKPIAGSEEEWQGNWCDKSDKTATHIFPYSLIKFVENIINSYICMCKERTIKSPLCVEELRTRFTIQID